MYAESQAVMDRVLGVYLVAQLPSHQVSSETTLQRIRRALRDERWGDALGHWMIETDCSVDVFGFPPDVFDCSAKIWTDDELPARDVQAFLSEAPLFDTRAGG